MVAKKFRITGKVQGVFFRISARDYAGESGLSGWIKNNEDGSVEGYVQGKEDAVDSFVKWCKHGPKRAKVETVEISNTELNNELKDFEIIN